jgi:hypothetical protein
MRKLAGWIRGTEVAQAGDDWLCPLNRQRRESDGGSLAGLPKLLPPPSARGASLDVLITVEEFSTGIMRFELGDSQSIARVSIADG